MALVATDYRIYFLASDCETCIAGITDAGVLETLSGFTVEAVDDLSIGDAELNWSTADANAEVLVVDLPAGDSEEVPLMVLGQAIKAVDLDFFDGYTETNLAVVDLDKDSWVMLGFSADDIPALSCGGVATYLKFLDMVHIGAFNSTTQGSGIPLATATSGNFRVYSDDAGAAIVNTGVGDTRGLLSRFLLTVDHSANEVRFSGAMGHIKSYDGIWGNEQVSGVYGYAELVRNSATLTLTDYGITAGVIGCVENIGVVTIDTNHILAGLAAISKITGDLAATGKTAGLLVTTYDTTNWSDGSVARIDWEYGLYIDSATVAGIEIADTPTTGLLISGACPTAIDISGLASTRILDYTTVTSVGEAAGGHLIRYGVDGAPIVWAPTIAGSDHSGLAMYATSVSPSSGLGMALIRAKIELTGTTAATANAGQFWTKINCTDYTGHYLGGHPAGLCGIIECVGTARTAPSVYAVMAGVVGEVRPISGTVDAGGTICGVHAKVFGTGAQVATGNVVGVLVQSIGSGAADIGILVQPHPEAGWTTGLKFDASYAAIDTAIDIGTCTTGIIVTGATNLGISVVSATLAVGDSYSGIRSAVTCADPNNAYGASGYFQATVSGTQAAHFYGFGSWVNIADSAIGGGASKYLCAQDNGIYAGSPGEWANTLVVFGMRMECVGVDADTLRFPFSINTGGVTGLTALFDINSLDEMSKIASATEQSEYVPLFRTSAGDMRYVRLYVAS